MLDIGCNVGYLTLAIAKDFQPSHILGVDIDESLVGVARKNIRHYCDESVEVSVFRLGLSAHSLPSLSALHSAFRQVSSELCRPVLQAQQGLRQQRENSLR